MKLFSALPLVTLLAASASAANFFSVASLQAPISGADAGPKVPGESPLQHCSSTDEDVLEIEKVDLVPNPPVPGQTLTIEASGILKDVIATGAKVRVTVKYGKYVTILNQEFDLCDQMGEVDQECPLDEGRMIIKKAVDIPAQVPPGTYNVQAMAYTVDERPITCLLASVPFAAPGLEL